MPYRVPRPIPHRESPPNLLVLWHLLSLDAPTVAALWTSFFARCAGVTLPWTEPAAIFVAVWMLYAADRLLDARPLPSGDLPTGLEERHHFHRRHRHAFQAALAGAGTVLAALLTRMDAETIRWESVLGLLLALWLFVIHARGSQRSGGHRLPKEGVVGVFFAAATVLPATLRSPHPALLAAPALLFGTVCTLNCVMLFRWEHSQAFGGKSVAPIGHPTTRWAADRASALVGIVIVAALAKVALIPGPRITAEASALSAAGLFVLDRYRRRIDAVTQRALADAVLLTPLLLWSLIGR